MFMRINDRTQINTDQIVKITLHTDRIIYDLVDDTQEVEWHMAHWGPVRFEELHMMLAPVVPASPGYFLVYRSGEGQEHYLESILAWRVDGVGCHPVGLDLNRTGEYYVLCPDGRIESSEGSIFDDIEAFLESAAGR